MYVVIDLLEKVEGSARVVIDLPMLENIADHRFKMKRPESTAMSAIPALDHFNKWNQPAIVLSIRFAPELDVPFRVRRDPPPFVRIRNEIPPSLPIECRHHIHLEIGELDG